MTTKVTKDNAARLKREMTETIRAAPSGRRSFIASVAPPQTESAGHDEAGVPGGE